MSGAKQMTARQNLPAGGMSGAKQTTARQNLPTGGMSGANGVCRGIRFDILRRMSSHDPQVAVRQEQKTKVLELGNSNRGAAAREVIPFLKSEFSEVRRLAASALRKLANAYPDAHSVAIALSGPALNDPHPQVQQYALKAMALYPKESFLFLDELKDVARNPTLKDYVRAAAAETVAAIESTQKELDARFHHWCSRCKRIVSQQEYEVSSARYGKPYCRHCFDEKLMEDKNFEATVEGAKRRRTEDGSMVQSLGEKRIADFLSSHRIAYTYDERIRIAGDARIRPDFYLPEFDLYIEYWGMDDPAYNENKLQKRILYQRTNKKLISLSYKEFDNLEDVLAEKLSRYIRL